MPISDTRKWKLASSPLDVRKVLVSYLEQKKAKLRVDTPSRIEADLGSQLMLRLMGALLLSPERLPVTIMLAMSDVGGETAIDATIQDRMGVGIALGTEGKFRKRIQSLFDELTRVLQG